jgi:hypothetical protein
MFVKPPNWNTMSVAERRVARVCSWVDAKDRKFATPQAAANYRRRAQRLADLISLKKTDRVPCLPWVAGFIATYAGITPHDVMYDYEKLKLAYWKYVEDFEPEYNIFSGSFNPGPVFDRLDYKVYSWPGHGVAKDRPFQTVEKEFMEAADYDDFLDDPEAWYLRTYMPRAFGALAPLGMLPPVYATMELPFVPAFFVPLGLPEMQQAFQALMDAGREALRWATAMAEIDGPLFETRGMPALPGGFTKAPFDILGDTLRSTMGIMMDKFRRPNKVLAAVERITPTAIRMGVQVATAADNPFVFIPMHKGADGYLSDKDFKTFYWPSFKATLLGLIAEGLIPYNFVEGSYNERLDVITDPDIPAGSIYWTFDKTNLKEVKKRFAGWAAFGAGIPAPLMYTGSPEQVEAWIRDAIETLGQDGGMAIGTGVVLDHAKHENVRAMFETTERYGNFLVPAARGG